MTSRSAFSARVRRFALGAIPILALAGAMAVQFGPALAGRDRLAFRDAGHFYPPLYDSVHRRLARGELPLWNPLDNTGIPVLGEATTGLFYPGKAIFFVGLSTEVALAYFVVLHWIAAAAGAWWLARSEGARPGASGVAALVYGLSAPLLFLSSNPPFLVGAAWLPWTVAASLRVVRRAPLPAVAWAAVTLAMPVLAGDPQTPVHALLVVAVVALVRTWRRGPRSGAPSVRAGSVRARFGELGRPLARLGFAAGLGAALASIQVLPALAWSRETARWAEPPAGVAQVLRGGPGGGAGRWYHRPPAGTHAARIYDFSVAPWQWAELAVPGGYGRLFPTNTWLGGVIAPGYRVWTPRLYVGLLPVVIWIASGFCRRGATVWSVAALLAALLACGRYGLVALARWGSGVAGGEILQEVDPALLGPYWWLVTFLPGYASFRYPAKWLPVFGLAVAVHAAKTLGRRAEDRRSGWTAVGVAAAALILFAATWLPGFASSIVALAEQRPAADRYWGPFLVDGAVREVRIAAAHALVVAGVLACVFLWNPGRRMHGRTRLAMLASVLAVDLLLAGRGIVATSPRGLDAAFGIGADVGGAIGGPAGGTVLSPRRVRAVAVGAENAWRQTSSPRRHWEVAVSERRTGFGRWHLAGRWNELNSQPSLPPIRVTGLWEAIARTGADGAPERRAAVWRRVERWLGASERISAGQPALRATAAGPLRLAGAVRSDIPDPAPVVRFVERVERIEPVADFSGAGPWLPRLERLLAEEGDAAAWIETPAGQDEPRSAVAGRAGGNGAARLDVAAATPERFAVRVTTARPGLLYAAQFQDGFWTARARRVGEPEWRAPTVHRANFIGQGVLLDAGDWEVEFSYRPAWLVPGMLLSLASMAVVLAGFGRGAFRAGRDRFRGDRPG